MPSGREIMERAATLLNDEDHIRWTLPELCDWLNEGVRAIVLAKPSASSESRVLTLQQGTLQTVPTTPTPAPLALVRIVRNIKDAGPPRLAGRTITITSQALLDAANPDWHDKTRQPYKREVRQYVFDEANPLEYYVYPGNDGTGTVEAVLSVLPTPLAATGATDAIGSYEGSVGLPEPYSVPLLDYVLFRALGKDDLGGDAGRAQGHYRNFATAIGLKIQVERASTPNQKKAPS